VILVPLAVDPAAVHDACGGDKALKRFAHVQLCDLLRQFGVLVFAGQVDEAQFNKAVKHLPIKVRKLWEEAFAVLPRVQVPDGGQPLSSIGSLPELRAAWSGRIRLAVFPRDRAGTLVDAIGAADADVTAIDQTSSIEIAAIQFCGAAKAFRDASATAQQTIPAGQHRDVTWDQRLAGPARHAKSGVIFDRYAGQCAVRWHRNRGSRRFDDCGLGWYLAKCGEAGVKVMTVFTSTVDDPSPDVLMTAITALWDAMEHGKLLELRVVWAQDWKFADMAHDRHLRFEARLQRPAQSVGIFDRRQLEQSVQWSYELVTDRTSQADVARERELTQLALSEADGSPRRAGVVVLGRT
jgi:hypothetical protein